MYCRVIACDFDGTGASGGKLAPEVAAALHRARGAGITTMLVTGRVLEDLRVALVDFSAFDVVVAENGAILWFPEREQTVQLEVPRDAGVLLRFGEVVAKRRSGDPGELYPRVADEESGGVVVLGGVRKGREDRGRHGPGQSNGDEGAVDEERGRTSLHRHSV